MNKWMISVLFWCALGLGLCMFAIAQQYNPSPANEEPGWMQPLQVVNRKLDAQAEQIRALQNDVVTLQNALDDLMEKDPTRAAIMRRWEELGEDYGGE